MQLPGRPGQTGGPLCDHGRFRLQCGSHPVRSSAATSLCEIPQGVLCSRGRHNFRGVARCEDDAYFPSEDVVQEKTLVPAARRGWCNFCTRTSAPSNLFSGLST